MSRFTESWQEACPPCHYCLTNDHRTTAHNACCQLRMLAQAPRHRLRAYTDTLSSAERDALRTLFVSEQTRLAKLKLTK